MRVNTLGLAVAFVLTVSGAYAMNGDNVGGLRTALRNLEAGFTGPKNLVNTEMQLPTNLVAMSEGLLDAGDLQRLRNLIPSFNSKKELFTRKSKTTDGKVIVDLLNKAIRRAEENERAENARIAAQRAAEAERARVAAQRERVRVNTTQRAVESDETERPDPERRARAAAARQRALAGFGRQGQASVPAAATQRQEEICMVCKETEANIARISGRPRVPMMQTPCCRQKICAGCFETIHGEFINPITRERNYTRDKCPNCRGNLFTGERVWRGW